MLAVSAQGRVKGRRGKPTKAENPRSLSSIVVLEMRLDPSPRVLGFGSQPLPSKASYDVVEGAGGGGSVHLSWNASRCLR